MADSVSIPVIDIYDRDADRDGLARKLVDAAADCGFLYIKNTGRAMAPAKVEQAFDISRTLFKSSLEDKQNCRIRKNNHGWAGMHAEALDPKAQRVGDFKEAFNFGPFSEGKATQPVPSSIESCQAQLAEFRASCNDLCREILHLFGIGLEIDPPEFFTRAHSHDAVSKSILRFLYYPPPSATPEAQNGDVRAGAHSDYGSVTLLFRLKGQAGLEISTRSGAWVPVPVCPPGTENDPSPPILVNIGDLLSYWTNGLFRSTVHRVAFEGGSVEGESSSDPRYSIAFFCHPADETPLGVVPSERVKSFKGELADAKNANPYAERKVLTAEEHLQMRLAAAYASIERE